jgi:hypothetical protein
VKPRSPLERLAGCCWLPRFVDKTRLLLAGQLPLLYRGAFGSAIGIDGFFLRHFRLSRGDFIRAVRASAGDEDVAAWFLAQAGVNASSIERWNQAAPTMGARGHEGRAIFQIVRWIFYPKTILHPVNSLFEAILQDEEDGTGTGKLENRNSKLEGSAEKD